jgi:hypothetical protein
VLLMLGMDWRDIGSRRIDHTSLLAVANEVLEVLYRTHLSNELRQAKESSALVERERECVCMRNVLELNGRRG